MRNKWLPTGARTSLLFGGCGDALGLTHAISVLAEVAMKLAGSKTTPGNWPVQSIGIRARLAFTHCCLAV